MPNPALFLTGCLVIALSACDERQPSTAGSTSAPASARAARPNAAREYFDAWKQIDRESESAASAVKWDSGGAVLDPTLGLTTLEEAFAALSRQRQVIGALLKASEIEYCDFGLSVTNRPSNERMSAILDVGGSVRKAMRFLRADAARAWSEGDIDGAVDRVAAMYGMCRHISQVPVMLIALTDSACVRLANETAQTMATGVGGIMLEHEHRRKLLAALDRLDASDPGGLLRAKEAEGSGLDREVSARAEAMAARLRDDVRTTRRALESQ